MAEPRMVKCAKLGHEGEGLERSPFKNELGQRIFESISREAWRGWIGHSTMLVNEYRVDVMSASGREFLLKECDKYFFGEGSSAPKEFVASPAAAPAAAAPAAVDAPEPDAPAAAPAAADAPEPDAPEADAPEPKG